MNIDTKVEEAEQLGGKLRELGLAIAESLGKEIELKDTGFESKSDIWDVVHPLLKLLGEYHPLIGNYTVPRCLPSTSVPFSLMERGYKAAMEIKGREVDQEVIEILRECQELYPMVWGEIPTDLNTTSLSY